MRRLITLLTGMLLFMVLRPASAATVPYDFDSDNTHTGTATVTNNSFDGIFLKSGTLDVSKASQTNGRYNYTLGDADCTINVTQTEEVYETIPLWIRRYEVGRDSEMDDYVVVSESSGGGAWDTFSMMTGTPEAINWSLSEEIADLYDLYAVIELACDNPDTNTLQVGSDYGFVETDIL